MFKKKYCKEHNIEYRFRCSKCKEQFNEVIDTYLEITKYG